MYAAALPAPNRDAHPGLLIASRFCSQVVKPQAAWQGMVAPILRGEVGDTFRVLFRNRAEKPYSMHPHGLRYQPAFSGAAFSYSTGKCSIVPPGGECEYFWEAPETAGPSSNIPLKQRNNMFVSSRAWWLHR